MSPADNSTCQPKTLLAADVRLKDRHLPPASRIRSHHDRLAWLAALGSSLLWSVRTPILKPLLASNLNPEMIAGLSTLFACGVLALFAAYLGKHDKPASPTQPRHWRILFVGGCYAGCSFTFIKSLDHASGVTALTALVGGSTPVIAMIQFFRRERIKRHELIEAAILLLILPIVLVPEFRSSGAIGFTLVVATPLLWGTAVAFTDKTLSHRQRCVAYCLGCLLLSVAMAPHIWLGVGSINAQQWLSISFAGAASQAGSLVLLIWAFAHASNRALPNIVMSFNLPLAVGFLRLSGQETISWTSGLACFVVVSVLAINAFIVFRD